MFITSFLPLWISIATVNLWTIIDFGVSNWCLEYNLIYNVLNIADSKTLELVVFLIIAILSTASMISISQFIKKQNTNTNNHKATIKSALKAKKLTSEFLLAYILPMVAFDFSSPRDLCLFIIYFVVLAFLCIRNNNVYTNIFLELRGYKLYECDIERKVAGDYRVYKNVLLISKLDVTEPTNMDITFWDFDNHIYLNTKGD